MRFNHIERLKVIRSENVKHSLCLSLFINQNSLSCIQESRLTMRWKYRNLLKSDFNNAGCAALMCV
jgi:hypothetical protein